jgi:hypothetical protein
MEGVGPPWAKLVSEGTRAEHIGLLRLRDVLLGRRGYYLEKAGHKFLRRVTTDRAISFQPHSLNVLITAAVFAPAME